MKFLKLRLLLIAAVGFAFSGTANAQNTQNIAVTATVPSFCIVNVGTTETTMDFGTLNITVAVAPFDATTTLAWRCSAGFNTDIEIGPGGSADQENRTMDSAGNSLAYNLYIDGTFTTIWGDGTGSTSTVGITGTGIGNVGNTTVFGRILLAAAQTAVVGVYTDTVLVTILP